MMLNQQNDLFSTHRVTSDVFKIPDLTGEFILPGETYTLECFEIKGILDPMDEFGMDTLGAKFEFYFSGVF